MGVRAHTHTHTSAVYSSCATAHINYRWVLFLSTWPFSLCLFFLLPPYPPSPTLCIRSTWKRAAVWSQLQLSHLLPLFSNPHQLDIHSVFLMCVCVCVYVWEHHIPTCMFCLAVSCCPNAQRIHMNKNHSLFSILIAIYTILIQLNITHYDSSYDFHITEMSVWKGSEPSTLYYWSGATGLWLQQSFEDLWHSAMSGLSLKYDIAAILVKSFFIKCILICRCRKTTDIAKGTSIKLAIN